MVEVNTEGRQKAMDEAVRDTADRTEFYGRARQENLAPLWKVLAGLVAVSPQPKAEPYRWRYRDVRPYLMEACDLVTAAEAERRVMILENPGLQGMSRATDNIFAGLQIINPGEVAPAHRHVASALRFIMEGSDAYTAVDGERTIMRPGDFVITPSWTWHDHGNFGDGPMIWLDGLDMHIVNLFNASFREEQAHQRHEITRPDNSSETEFGYGMMPANHRMTRTGSPLINYPYARTREVLGSMRSHLDIDPHHGFLMKYINPLNGDWAMPRIATWMRMLPAGFVTKPYRSTDATVFVVVEGRGQSRIGDREFDWEENDVFVAPSWALQEHQASTEAVIFSYSDRAVQEKLEMWREQRD